MQLLDCRWVFKKKRSRVVKKRPFKYVSPPSDRVPEMRALVCNINLKMNYNIEAHIFYQPSLNFQAQRVRKTHRKGRMV